MLRVVISVGVPGCGVCDGPSACVFILCGNSNQSSGLPCRAVCFGSLPCYGPSPRKPVLGGRARSYVTILNIQVKFMGGSPGMLQSYLTLG